MLFVSRLLSHSLPTGCSEEPEKYNEYAEANGLETRAIKPAILAYLFCESSSLEKVDPFVCIAFESFEETKKKIVASAKEHLHIDLENWDEIIKKGLSIWKDKEGVYDNEWNIPFDDLFDNKVTVTMINAMPSEESICRFSEDEMQIFPSKCRSKLIDRRKKRLDELKRIAGKRHFSSKEEEKIMQEIERKAGCKVHKLPFIPNRIIKDVSPKDGVALSNEEFENILKELCQKNQDSSMEDYISEEHFVWPYFFG